MISKHQNDVEEALCIAVISLVAMGVDRGTIQRQINQVFEEISVAEEKVGKPQLVNVKFKSLDKDEIMTVKIGGPDLSELKIGQFHAFFDSFKKYGYILVDYQFLTFDSKQ